VVEPIANTTTKTGLTIRCELDNTYPKGIKVSEEQMATLNLKGDEFHPDWNYSIFPRGRIVEREFLGVALVATGRGWCWSSSRHC
jgi:hypothetical protein